VGSWFVRPGTQVFLGTWVKVALLIVLGTTVGCVCLLDGFVTLSSRGGGYSCLRLDLVVFSLRRNRYRKSGWLQTGVRVFNYSMRGGHEYGE
jgi:hypothetical protein